jgi:phage terminase large subunit-like protein
MSAYTHPVLGSNPSVGFIRYGVMANAADFGSARKGFSLHHSGRGHHHVTTQLKTAHHLVGNWTRAGRPGSKGGGTSVNRGPFLLPREPYSDHVGLSLKQRLAQLPAEIREPYIAGLPEQALIEMNRGEWWYVARPEQIPPEGPELVYLFMAGRGSGKSRAGSEWIVDRVLKHPFDSSGVPTEWLVVADTLADARTINAEGPSGILNVLARRRVDHRYKQSPRPMVLFPDGAKIYLEGADDPDTGRGYNAAGVLCDELAKWIKPYETWYEGLLPALRADLLNDHPRAFVTTTPKPIKLLVEWLSRHDDTIHVITGSTFDNAINLSMHALRELKLRYAGTALGQQELYGKLLELGAGGLFRRMDIVKNRVLAIPEDRDITFTVVGVDPNLTGEDAQTGIVVVCRADNNDQFILADRSVPDSGRAAALAIWRAAAEFRADLVVYEENLGKRYLQEVLQDAYQECVELGMFPKGTSPPMKPVHAKHGKKTRAEPVAMRNEQGRLHIVGELVALEDEMVLYDPVSTRDSPDRMDAMVHASIHLMAGERRAMRVSDPSQYDFRMDQSVYDLSRLL